MEEPRSKASNLIPIYYIQPTTVENKKQTKTLESQKLLHARGLSNSEGKKILPLFVDWNLSITLLTSLVYVFYFFEL